MARNSQAILIKPWAESGDREVPESQDISPRLVRSTGWPVTVSQLGGTPIRRFVFNQLLREITGMLSELNAGGSIPEYDGAIEYINPAFVRYEGELYISTGQSGLLNVPGVSNDWKVY